MVMAGLSSSSEVKKTKNRNVINWRHIGIYNTIEELLEAKKTEKVSKRKIDTLRTGVKTTYRCNSWKRTRCPFQMYALHSNDGKIYLYEGGEHDHTSNCSAYVANLEGMKERRKQNRDTISGGGRYLAKDFKGEVTDHRLSYSEALAKQLVSAQDDFLTSLIQQATSMSASPAEEIFGSQENEDLSLSDSLFLNKLNDGALKEEDGSSSSASGLISHGTGDFQLSDGTSIAALLQIATDSDLTFTFNSRRCGEYCFESNKKNGRMVVFGDAGSEIRVAQKLGDEEITVETWRKSDWNQFCWAVRGACLHFLRG